MRLLDNRSQTTVQPSNTAVNRKFDRTHIVVVVVQRHTGGSHFGRAIGGTLTQLRAPPRGSCGIRGLKNRRRNIVRWSSKSTRPDRGIWTEVTSDRIVFFTVLATTRRSSRSLVTRIIHIRCDVVTVIRSAAAAKVGCTAAVCTLHFCSITREFVAGAWYTLHAIYSGNDWNSSSIAPQDA